MATNLSELAQYLDGREADALQRILFRRNNAGVSNSDRKYLEFLKEKAEDRRKQVEAQEKAFRDAAFRQIQTATRARNDKLAEADMILRRAGINPANLTADEQMQQAAALGADQDRRVKSAAGASAGRYNQPGSAADAVFALGADGVEIPPEPEKYVWKNLAPGETYNAKMGDRVERRTERGGVTISDSVPGQPPLDDTERNTAKFLQEFNDPNVDGIRYSESAPGPHAGGLGMKNAVIRRRVVNPAHQEWTKNFGAALEAKQQQMAQQAAYEAIPYNTRAAAESAGAAWAAYQGVDPESLDAQGKMRMQMAKNRNDYWQARMPGGAAPPTAQAGQTPAQGGGLVDQYLRFADQGLTAQQAMDALGANPEEFEQIQGQQLMRGTGNAIGDEPVEEEPKRWSQTLDSRYRFGGI